MWKLIAGRGKRWIVPQLAGGWMIDVRPSARARDLRRRLPELLAELERRGATTLQTGRPPMQPLALSAEALGIVRAAQGPTEHPGSIYLLIDPPANQRGAYAPANGDPLAVWLSQWLSEKAQADNIYKLAKSGADERHVFVLVPGFTPAPFAVIDLLADSSAPLPSVPAVLPKCITHVWTMSLWTDWGDGFRWSADIGWRRFSKIKPHNATNADP